jgi:hypothetical protein
MSIGLAWEFLSGVSGLGSLPFLSKNGGDGAALGFDAQLQWAVRQKLGVVVLLNEAPATIELDVSNIVLSEVFPVIDNLYYSQALQNSLPDDHQNLIGVFQAADVMVAVTLENIPYYNNTSQLKISYDDGAVVGGDFGCGSSCSHAYTYTYTQSSLSLLSVYLSTLSALLEPSPPLWTRALLCVLV